jgi:hypothetical protein
MSDSKIKFERIEEKSLKLRITCGSWELWCNDDMGGSWELRCDGKSIAQGSYSWALDQLRDVVDIGSIHYREMVGGPNEEAK